MQKTLSSFISGCFRKFMNLGITKKLILLYLFVILLPTSLLLSHFYKLNMASLALKDQAFGAFHPAELVFRYGFHAHNCIPPIV